MFKRPNILFHMAAAKLSIRSDDDGVQQREAEISLVLETFMESLARELGAKVHAHLFDHGQVRTELDKITFDLHAPKQAIRVCAGVDGSVELITLRHVEIGAFTVVKRTDEEAGTDWLKATLKARFDLSPREQRDFLAAQFGAQLYYTFERENKELPFEEADVQAPPADPDAGDVLEEQKPKRGKLKKKATNGSGTSAEA